MRKPSSESSGSVSQLKIQKPKLANQLIAPSHCFQFFINYLRDLYNRLVSFLDKHHVLFEKQFGFRPKHSTDNAILSI